MLDNLLKLAQYEMIQIQEEKKPTLFPAEIDIEEVIAARKQGPQKTPIPIADARKLERLRRLCLGYHEVVGAFYDQMEFAKVFDSRQVMSRRLFKQAILLRLAAPGRSKRAHSRKLSKEIGVEVQVEKLYRMMDTVTEERIEQLKERVCEETMEMLGGTLNVLFFDVTSLSFASEQADELHRKEFSKDGKPHRVQVVLALVQTQEGLPITYELFPGNTTDVKTLEPVIERLKERFKLNQVVVVDAGLLSEPNLALLKSLGCEYVVAARLRSLNQTQTKIITGKQSWETLSTGQKVCEHTLGGRRLILRYCPKKAALDRQSRNREVKKAKKHISAGVKEVGKNDRFLQIKPDGVSLDEEAIARDRQFDGLHGVWTSLEDMKSAQVCAQYGELWRIEEDFRVSSHTMAIRPVFHWVERRVHAHIAICFVAFALLRILRHRYNTRFGAKEQLSEARILSELSNIEALVICDRGTGAEYIVPVRPTKEGIQLYQAVGRTLQHRTVLFKPGTVS